MSGVSTADLLRSLDASRRAAGEPSPGGDVVREYSPGRSGCRITYAAAPVRALPDLVAGEIARAESEGYELEWKLYGHDALPGLESVLLAAGFQAGAPEKVLGLPVTEDTLAAIHLPGWQVRRVHGEAGLDEVASIARDTGRRDAEAEKRRLALELRENPAALSVYVAYVAGQAAASGRIHFSPDGGSAELAGGRTRTAHRRRGLFTALVAVRLREALARDRRYAFVDALPSSGPVLTKLGFRFLTVTQPFVYQPRGGARVNPAC